MAEYFRDEAHQDVLLLIDNIFRFVQAGMEVSGLPASYHPVSATNRRWRPIWPNYKSGSVRQRLVQLLRSKRFTYQLTTSPILRPSTHSHI